MGDPNVPKKLLLVRPGLIQNSINVMRRGNGFSLPTGDWVWEEQPSPRIFMRPSSVGGGRILRRTLSVCLSVRLSVRPVRGSSFVVFVYFFFTVEPSYERTSKIEKRLFSLMGQLIHVCTFRHAQRAAYRTAISAAQTCSSLIFFIFFILTFTPFFLFQVTLLTKILKSFSSSVSLARVCFLCVYV